MNEYFFDIQQHWAQLNELDQSREKWTRKLEFEAAAVTVETANSCAGSEPGSAAPAASPQHRLWVDFLRFITPLLAPLSVRWSVVVGDGWVKEGRTCDRDGA
ncbi:PREDICTED: putative nuclease HARBI1 [Prunus dulcis]|uniref:PREDICTED: putative nuclease HARBI1 n=1 Tax=Prunus dulcis TaxID=3755 RepID=A0A5E4G7I7_PRUDU|nr:hypothetical protein L3X38_002304 [Prunus dulcis]VVA35696.1 PREDICTED: putative nuclease HARBI1 [Prunus dulcis]